MNRRNFFVSLGGIVVCGPEVLERLMHVRKSFPSAGIPRTPIGVEHALIEAMYTHKARLGAWPNRITTSPVHAAELTRELARDNPRGLAPLTFMGAAIDADPFAPLDNAWLTADERLPNGGTFYSASLSSVSWAATPNEGG